MKLVKKLVLSFSIVLTMAVAFVIGYIGNKSVNNSIVVDSAPIQTSKNDETIYHYSAGEVRFQRGTDVINYNYTPSVNASAETVKPVAYEYCFGNNLNRSTAVSLKSIDTTGVNVTYAYSYNQKLTNKDKFTSYSNFTLQKLENPDDKIYIYLLVTPTSATIPTTFTQKVVWYYGIPQQVHITDITTGQVVDTQPIVAGQQIDKKTLPIPEAPAGEIVTNSNGQSVEIPYYFDAWYKDKDFKYIADEKLDDGQNLYAHFANLPTKCISGNTVISSTTATLPTKLIIPMGITTIGYSAFKSCTGLTDVVIPSTVKTVGSYAFYNCTGLTDVTIPSAVTSIGQYAFNNCSKLTSVSLPEGLKSIDLYAFSACSELTNITMPSTVTSIGQFAFNNCSKLTSITIPSGVKTIDTKTFFSCSKLESVTIMSGVTKIEAQAFDFCSSLTSITIPSTVKSLGNYVFRGCSNLANLTINEGLTKIGNYAFYQCTSLTNVVLPSSVTSLGLCSFSGCTKLTNITISLGLITIGNNAFSACTSLTSVTIPSSVTQIGQYAFDKCSALTSIHFDDATTWYVTTSANYTGGEVVDVSIDDAKNVIYFTKVVDDGGYRGYYWYKQ